MRRSWQIWFTFVACLIAVVAAVGWLSLKVIQADGAEAAAQRQADLEESARLALWRMEAAMTALVSQESARPPLVYHAYSGNPQPTAAPGAVPTDAFPSPLLTQLPPLIQLHFEIDRAGRFSSPQVPDGEWRAWAVPAYLSDEQIDRSAARLAELCASIDPPQLLADLPPVEPAATVAPPLGRNVPPPGTIAASNAASQLAAPSAPAIVAADDPFADSAVDRGVPQQPPQPFPRDLPEGAQSAAITADLQQQAVEQAPLLQQSVALKQAKQAVQGQVEYQARQRFNELNRRGQAFTANTGNSLTMPQSVAGADAQTSAMTPRWIDGHLLLLRRVVQNGQTIVQGCELDWPAIQQELLGEIADLLSQARVEPIVGADPSAGLRRLASLPVKLIPGPLPADTTRGLSSVRASLLLTWVAIGLAVAAAAILLHGVLALGERRAAFVSAVTHELRTPLTTFRMYAEMLSEGMVASEDDRLSYLRTLRVEADRLSHLVANVLAYARLERGRSGGRLTQETVRQMLHVVTPRLVDRAAEARFVVTVHAPPDVLDAVLLTDTAAVEQILFNLVDNACKYAAAAEDRTLQLSMAAEPRRIVVRLRDHGPGVAAAQRRWLFQPFRKSAREAAHSAPGVGLGLALCRRLARDLGGELRYEPTAQGACFALTLPRATQPHV